MSTFVCSLSLNNNSKSAGLPASQPRTKHKKTGSVKDVQLEASSLQTGNCCIEDVQPGILFIKEEVVDYTEDSYIDRSNVVVHLHALDEIKRERVDIVQEVNPQFSQEYLDESTEDALNKPNYGRPPPSLKLDPNRFGKHLTLQEMVRLHFDPVVSKVDLSKEPVMLLKKVDSCWPLTKSTSGVTTTEFEIKEEITEDWEKAAEEEILRANKEWSKINYRAVEHVEGRVAKAEHMEEEEKVERVGNKTPDSLEEVDDPEEMEEDFSSPLDDDDDDEYDDDDCDDDDYRPNRRSFSSTPDIEDINENLRIQTLEENSGDQFDVKLELGEDDIKYEDIKIVEIGGFKIETFGDYSKCPKCEKHIKSTFIIRHIKLHDIPVRILKCPHQPCKTTFTRTNNMYRHMKVVHNDPMPYICVYKECTAKFAESRNLREHVGQEHKRPSRLELEELDTSETKYKCEFPGCEREYGKRQHLKEHFRKHTGDMRYACEVCGERFFVHGHMKRHLYSHTGIKPHACRWKCGAIFASYGGRMKHERAQHSDNPYKLECDICGRPFRFDRELDKHKLTHLAPSERVAYRCSYCFIIFDSISHRERHEKRHQENDNFQCEECHKFFKNEKNLRHHSKAHHEGKKPEIKRENEFRKKERKEPPKYQCHMCDIPIMFALTALRRHLARKHSTNFKCEKENCNKTFAKQYQFDAHMKLHSHRHCHLCGKDFKRKQNADIHLMGVHGLTKEGLQELGR